MKRVNRFLLRERYEPKDLFNAAKPHIQLVGGTKSYDDTVIDKPYSNPKLTELIGYFWEEVWGVALPHQNFRSGKHHPYC